MVSTKHAASMPNNLHLLLPPMYKKSLIASALISMALLSSCKPTQRTAPDAKKEDKKEQQTQPAEALAEAKPEVKPELPAQAIEPAAAVSEKKPPVEVAAKDAPIETRQYIVGIRTTSQEPDIRAPWQMARADENEFCGIYLGDNKILAPAEAARDASYIEIKLSDGGRSATAKVLRYDTDLDLSLLTLSNADDAEFFKDLKPLALGEPLKLGDTAQLWGMRSNKQSEIIELSANSAEGFVPNLIMRAASGPSMREDGMPVVKDGKLVGVAGNYSQNNQSFYVVNADFIKRFLDATPETPVRVPILGVESETIEDPVLRKYLKLSDAQKGLYISEVSPLSAAHDAGLMKGDVIIGVEGMDLDAEGYVTHPTYGRINAGSAIRSLKPIGEILNIRISREGNELTIPVALNRQKEEKSLIRELLPNEKPSYIIHGGIVFQPLSDDHRGSHSSSLEFLRAEEKEQELIAKGYKQLIGLTNVIATPATLGYEKLGFTIVEQVNGKVVRDINHLAQLLDEPTANGITSIQINKAPYMIYVDQAVVAAANDTIRKRAIPKLRRLSAASAPSAEASPQPVAPIPAAPVVPAAPEPPAPAAPAAENKA